jgi:peptide chain release factor 3
MRGNHCQRPGPPRALSLRIHGWARAAPETLSPDSADRAGLLGEGAVQVLHSTDDFRTDPILAAVGALQFEVVQARAAAGEAECLPVRGL